MSKLLITGASGYIGGKLAEFYSQSGREIRLLVRDPQRLPDSLKKTCEVVPGDLTKPDSLKDSLLDIEAVIHAAGLLGHWGTPERDLWAVNVRGTEHLIQAACAAQVRRFIHLSAGGVTGPVSRQVANEDYPPQPRTPYEKSKWEGEKLALKLATELNFNLLVVRPTFTYGPGDPHKLKLFQTIQKHRFAFIGDGFSLLHPVYIEDLLLGIDLALKSNLSGVSLILGGERCVSKREFIYSLADALGVRRPTVHLPRWLANSLAYGGEFAATLLNFNPPLTRSRVLMLSGNWGYSIERAKALLEYQPQISLPEGLTRTIVWYREHGWL